MNDPKKSYDLVVIGGGINGVGIAADAAGRGLKVLLAEQNDLGSATSSNSSKLIHGGLRYLEHYQFRLVKEALAEREVLLRNAPHIMNPLTFRLPHQPHLRSAMLIKAGLFLYDHLAKRVTLPASKTIKFGPDSPLNPDIHKGFEYSDGWVDDARLVVLNAMAARERGAVIKTQTRCIEAKRLEDHWQVKLQQGDHQLSVKTKGVVNATGPWVTKLFEQTIHAPAPKPVRLVKGSHIVVPRLHDQPQAYMLQHTDKRVVFVIPYEQDLTLIGTTDVEYHGDPADVAISQAEIDYLVNVSNHYFKRSISPADVITSFSGVRPLLDDQNTAAQTASRDYTLELDEDNGQLPLLSVFGGKITTYRRLAEAALNKLKPFYPDMAPPWTADASLPGGNMISLQSINLKLAQDFPWVWPEHLRRYSRCYGTLTYLWLDGISNESQLGINFGEGLYQAEVDYLIKHEWAHTAEDIIWRRTKLGLRMSATQVDKLSRYLASKVHIQAA